MNDDERWRAIDMLALFSAVQLWQSSTSIQQLAARSTADADDAACGEDDDDTIDCHDVSQLMLIEANLWNIIASISITTLTRHPLHLLLTV